LKDTLVLVVLLLARVVYLIVKRTKKATAAQLSSTST
jgi:hypothetical protein